MGVLEIVALGVACFALGVAVAFAAFSYFVNRRP